MFFVGLTFILRSILTGYGYEYLGRIGGTVVGNEFDKYWYGDFAQ